MNLLKSSYIFLFVGFALQTAAYSQTRVKPRLDYGLPAQVASKNCIKTDKGEIFCFPDNPGTTVGGGCGGSGHCGPSGGNNRPKPGDDFREVLRVNPGTSEMAGKITSRIETRKNR